MARIQFARGDMKPQPRFGTSGPTQRAEHVPTLAPSGPPTAKERAAAAKAKAAEVKPTPAPPRGWRASITCKRYEEGRDGARWYAVRKKRMRLLGFPDYAAYLHSELWASIRRRVLARDKGRCCACGEQATQVHHSKYTSHAMAGQGMKHFHSVCRACHHWAEVAPDGRKRSLREANAWLNAAARKRGQRGLNRMAR